MHFIYVFDEADKRRLEAFGYKLLKEDERNSVYVFENIDGLAFDLEAGSFVYTDTLTF